jgi:TonB-linked SusC/RagA family outer membrane protein
VHAQDITINLPNTTVRQAVLFLGDKYDYNIVVATDGLDMGRKVSVVASSASIEEVLDLVFAGQEITYSVSGKKVSVKHRNDEAPSQAPSDGLVLVSGTVLDETGQPLPGAGVMEKGTTNGIPTDIDGKYSLRVKPGTVLAFTFIGYKEVLKTVPADGGVLNVSLMPDTDVLEEVVIVGYGVQKRANLTGAVSTINFSDEVSSRPVTSVSSVLSGLSAGLSATQTSGRPGSDGATLRVRGNGTLNNNNPLVLVDGIEYSMDNVNPQDIASITVLKDASSTAIYGSRAANGVILVTTKSGETDKFMVSYSFNGAWKFPSLGSLGWVSDYAEHMSLVNEAADNIGMSHIFSDASIAQWKIAKAFPGSPNQYGVPNHVAYPNTDWFDELFGVGFTQIHNVSMQGGTEKLKAFFSLGYTDNPGIMQSHGIDSSTKKIDFRLNVESTLNSWLTTGARLFGERQSYGLADVNRAFEYLYQTTPGIYPGSADKWGVVALQSEEHNNANNIFRAMAGSGGFDTVYRLNASFYAKAKLFEGLNFEATGNFSPTFEDYNTYSIEKGTWDYVNDTRFLLSELSAATNQKRAYFTYRLNTEILLRYNKTFENHDIGALGGFTTNTYRNRDFSVEKQSSPDWTVIEMSAYSDLISSGSSTSEWGLMSYFGRANYAYSGKYLLEANLRYDGSSRFAPERRWGLFPSFSAGWNIGKESFLDGAAWISALKLRASWGKTGNNNSGNYAWQSIFDAVNVVVAGKERVGLLTNVLGNTDLVWETTYTSDLGVDYGLFDDKLTGEIDFYVKNTSGILFKPTLYVTMGNVSGSYANLAAVRNTGLEASIKYRDGIGRDFKYSVGLNASYNIGVVTKYQGKLQKGWQVDRDGNKIQYINNIEDVAQSGFGGYILEDHILGDQYLFDLYKGSGGGYGGIGAVDPGAGPVDGMIRTPQDMAWMEAMIAAGYRFSGGNTLDKSQLWYGDFIYADRNGDGDYGDENDRHFTGHSSQPLWNLGLNLSLSWKNLSFHALLTGAFGFWLNWRSSYYNTSIVQNGYGISRRIADNHYFYDPAGDPSANFINATYPRLTLNSDMNNAKLSDFYHYRGDYVKLRTVQLSYTLPEDVCKRIRTRGIRVFVSADNLLTMTSYPGLDPEIGTSITYPLTRSFNLGANVNF